MSIATTLPGCDAPQSKDARPVLRERGQREVFCGLTGIVWLHRKMELDAKLMAPHDRGWA